MVIDTVCTIFQLLSGIMHLKRVLASNQIHRTVQILCECCLSRPLRINRAYFLKALLSSESMLIGFSKKTECDGWEDLLIRLVGEQKPVESMFYIGT